jgi:two-component system, chemotaxis family, CheB/CheR fusion protein
MGLAIRKSGHKLGSTEMFVSGKDSNLAEANGGRKHMKDTAIRRVLLVDDHQVACKSTAILLEMSGYKVRTAFNGRTAIEIAGEFSPDIIILDIGLPDIGGYELLNRLKQFKELQTSKFIALTGFEEEAARQSQTEVEFHHFLRKPVDTSQLRAILNA